MNEKGKKTNKNILSEGLKVKCKGELDLAGFKLPCYVLEDGTRVLSSRGMQNALKMTDENGEQERGPRLRRYLEQKSLQPFVYRGDKDPAHFDPIICYDRGTKIYGYEATRLADFCGGILEARRNINLSTRQAIIAKQCEILLDAFSKVGIIALIDESTGYQYERERNELQKQWQRILGLYILDEPQKWEKIFPWTFYREIFRLYNLPFTAENIARPSFIGRLTNKYIYGNLPKGILERLKSQTPKTKGGNWKHNLHQLLTTEVGREDLKKTINTIEAFFLVSENMEEFKKLEEKYRIQKKVLYADANLNIANTENEKKQIKADFDKKFKTLLSVPAPKKKGK